MSRVEKFTAKLGENIRESMGSIPTGGAVGPLPAPSSASTQYQGITRPKEALTIPLDRIMPDPDQPRKEFDEEPLDQLAASLKARGQLQPIRVRWNAVFRQWVIIAGERRYRAAVKAGLASLLCVEAKNDMTADEVLEDQLIENCVREDLKPIEQAKAFKALIESRGYSRRQLGEVLNISHMAVNRALGLLELPEDLQHRVTEGEIAASVASEISKLDDPEEQRRFADEVVSKDMTRDQVVEAVRGKTTKTGGKGRGAKPKLLTTRIVKTTSGFKVTVEHRKGFDAHTLLAALEDATARIRAEIEAA